jgi:hypothetical protein
MPRLLTHIDAIARQKQRGVLYITFHSGSILDEDWAAYDWEEDPIREKICNWLTEHLIPWEPCGDIASENSMIKYRGQIYLDIPYDENNSEYILARDYLENPDGSFRFEPAIWWYIPLEVAMENAHHDEPGYWDKWVEDFWSE